MTTPEAIPVAISPAGSGINKWVMRAETDPEGAKAEWESLKPAQQSVAMRYGDVISALNKLGLPSAPPMGARRMRKSRKVRKTKKATRKGKKSYSRRR